MQKVKSTTIADKTYTVHQLDGMTSALLLPRVLAIVAPGLARLGPLLGKLQATAAKSGEDLENLDVPLEDLAVIVGEVCRGASDPKELESVIKTLLSTAYEGPGETVKVTDVMSVEFQGRTLDLYRLLWFAAVVNYGGFFGELAAAVPAAKKREAKEAAAPASQST